LSGQRCRRCRSRHAQPVEDFWRGVSFTYDGRGRPAWVLRDGRMITQAQMEQRERLFKAGHDPDADYVPDIDGRDATLGPIIAVERGMRGMTQRDLAALAGVTQSMVARLERGMREPSWRTFRLLLEAMRLEPVVDVREYDDQAAAQTTAPSSSSESVGGP
jgi:DNA-binding XRE family transcriptional regulator